MIHRSLWPGLFLHSIAQILQLGIMTKEMEASYGCDDLVQPPLGAPTPITVENGRICRSTGKSYDAGMTAFGTVSKEHDRSVFRRQGYLARETCCTPLIIDIAIGNRRLM